MFLIFFCFFFNDTAHTAIYTYGHTLSLHDALPIYGQVALPLHAALGHHRVELEDAPADRRLEVRPLRQGLVEAPLADQAPGTDGVGEDVDLDHDSRRSWLFWGRSRRSEEHTSELQSLMRISYAVFCLKKKTKTIHLNT